MAHDLLSEIQTKDHLVQFYMVRGVGDRAFSFQSIEAAVEFYEKRAECEPGKWQLSAVIYDFGYRIPRLPATREEWEQKNPAFQPRFLAWLRTIGATTRDYPPLNVYMAWNTARLAEYRKEKGLGPEDPLGDKQDDYTDWLWKRGDK